MFSELGLTKTVPAIILMVSVWLGNILLGLPKGRFQMNLLVIRIKEYLSSNKYKIYLTSGIFVLLFGWFIVDEVYRDHTLAHKKIDDLQKEISAYKTAPKNVSPNIKTNKNIAIKSDDLKLTEQRKAIADKLAWFRIRGLTIQNQCWGGSPLYIGKTPQQSYVQWDAEIEVFFRDKLTDSEKADLMDVYNLVISNETIPSGLSQENRHTWIFVGRKIIRLEQLNQKYK